MVNQIELERGAELPRAWGHPELAAENEAILESRGCRGAVDPAVR